MCNPTRRDVLHDFLGERAANSRDLVDPAPSHEVFHVLREGLELSRRALVRQAAERVLAEDVEHVRDLAESSRDLLVPHVRSRCPAAVFIVSRAFVRLVIWTGTCGFGRRQADVLRQLDAVEIQETFYRPVSVERAVKWRAAAAQPFRFCVKASQFITHEATSPTYRRSGRIIPDSEKSSYGSFQDTRPVREGWEATRAIAEAVRASAIVFQTPASFGPTETNRNALYRFFESIRTDAIKAIELRGPWAVHIVEKMCEDLGLVHAVDRFEKEPATYGLAYFRLHGSPPGKTMYRYAYTDADLGRLRAICREYDDVYVMFNNLSMHADALRFRLALHDSADSSVAGRE